MDACPVFLTLDSAATGGSALPTVLLRVFLRSAIAELLAETAVCGDAVSIVLAISAGFDSSFLDNAIFGDSGPVSPLAPPVFPSNASANPDAAGDDDMLTSQTSSRCFFMAQLVTALSTDISPDRFVFSVSLEVLSPGGTVPSSPVILLPPTGDMVGTSIPGDFWCRFTRLTGPGMRILFLPLSELAAVFVNVSPPNDGDTSLIVVVAEEVADVCSSHHWRHTPEVVSLDIIRLLSLVPEVVGEGDTPLVTVAPEMRCSNFPLTEEARALCSTPLLWFIIFVESPLGIRLVLRIPCPSGLRLGRGSAAWAPPTSNTGNVGLSSLVFDDVSTFGSN